ncbi:MAG: aminotransferase class V-fold PLP-dependent enzyme, partial [Sinobacteraceae bacterium]|nr:aminotransferase class V-fold PLP-dependent enzyme [Nevskiaceae bacterium]
MSTGTPTAEELAEAGPQTGGARGWPDVASITRMANAFFAALPASVPADIPSGPPGGTPVHGLPAVGIPAHPPLQTPDPMLGLAEGLPVSATTPTFYFLDPIPQPGTVAGLPLTTRHPPFDVATVRRDFPILSERINGRPLIWLDNAATTQKPQAVIDRLAHFYAHENSNIHRAAHELAARSTDAYEGARATVQRFLGASSPDEIVFVRGATEAINLVAQSWGRQNILPGDEIVISHLEHHANIVPWQLLASEKSAKLKVIPVDDSGQILLEEYQRL